MKKLLPILLLVFLLFPPALEAGVWEDAGVEKIGPVRAPDFTLSDTAGKMVKLKDFKGEVVLVTFWATWCPPCKEEMPSLDKLQTLFDKKGLIILAINDYEPKKKAMDFVKKNGYRLTVLIDEKGEVSKSYKASFLPTTFIIDRNGMATGRAIGERKWASPAMLKLIEELLKK